MKTLRKLLFIIIVIMGLLAAYGFFLLPAQYKIERAVVIKAPVANVFSAINNLKAWPKWVSWWKSDPDLYFTYGAITEGVGAEVEWGSDKQGSGHLSIVSSTYPGWIAYEIRYSKADEVTTSHFEFSEENSSTRVKWIDEIDLGYNPYFRYLGFFIDGMVGDSFELGLTNLKRLLEK